MNSPIANPGTLFQFEDFNGEYDGAQGFHVPRDGLYNITVAGASGGEGLCNYHYGFGRVIGIQVRLITDYEYLILVGHKGTSVCDVPENANHPVCQQPRPTNLTEAQACNDAWFNWTTHMASQSNKYGFNGGGGGGGASMIWPRTSEGKQFTDLPIVITPGGGGASAILDYDSAAEQIELGFIDELGRVYSLNNPAADNERIYSSHVNGHINRYAQGWPVGLRGYRFSETGFITSGAGSG